MIRIGIDPSITCTGVCVYDDETDTNIYYIIPGNPTKKVLGFKNSYIYVKPYNKVPTTNLEYADKERIKTSNVSQIADIIDDIIKTSIMKNAEKREECRETWRNDVEFIMEGISYGSAGAGQVADLAGLNYIIRLIFKKYSDSFTIVPPTKLKSFAVGNGAADKDLMVASWRKLDKNIANIDDIKIDDIADAYFLAHYSE